MKTSTGGPRGKQYGKSVQIPKAADIVAGTLRRQIVRGIIGDGEGLPTEAELMTQFNVSRPTLREALRVLEAEDLIRVRRGARGGMTAHRMSPELVSRYAGLLLQTRGVTLLDVYQAQITFEPACVRRLAETRSDEDLAELERTIEREREAMTAGDDRVERIAFHARLIELSGNQTLILMSEIITSVLVSAATHDVPVGGSQRTALRDHEEVVRLIRDRDGEGAHDLWERHLRSGMEAAIEQVGATGQLVDVTE